MVIYKDNIRHLSHFNFILFIKRLDFFTINTDLYNNGLNTKLFEKILNIEKCFMQLMNVYNTKYYNIDTLLAIKSYAKHTKVANYKNKLLIFHKYPTPICNIIKNGGHLFRIIPYSCRQSHYRSFDKNIKYNVLDLNDVKPITQTHLNMIKKLVQLDLSLSEGAELEAIRRVNERNLFYRKHLNMRSK